MATWIDDSETAGKDDDAVELTGGEQRYFVVCHAERCDFVFGGPYWIDRCINGEGIYSPNNINLPRKLYEREGGYSSYYHDPPLTEIGVAQARLTGRAFRDRKIGFDAVYSSCALRCIETLDAILQGMTDTTTRIKVEPGLYEWTFHYQEQLPKWMKCDELSAAGYLIDASYEPYVKYDGFILRESLTNYYERSYALMLEMTKRHRSGNVLLVGHSATHDVVSRQLCGGEPRGMRQYSICAASTPYVACLEISQHDKKGWRISGCPIPPLCNSYNTLYKGIPYEDQTDCSRCEE